MESCEGTSSSAFCDFTAMVLARSLSLTLTFSMFLSLTCHCLCLHRPGARQEGGDGGAGVVQALAQDERQDGVAVRPHVSDPPVQFLLAPKFYF